MKSSHPVVDRAELREQVEGRQWYHTLELAPGVETPGWFDLRPIVAQVPLPGSLHGQRCLDVGTFDGFWAFEMERRGGEVMAIDVIDPRGWDWPARSEPAAVEALAERKRGGVGFEIAREALGSGVERRELSIYELTAAGVGEFDLIYIGSLLLHLRDPVGALMRAREVCRGTLVLCETIDLGKSIFVNEPIASLDGLGRPWWWRPNVAALERMVESAGFRRVRPTRRLRIPPGRGRGLPPLSLARLRHRSARRELLETRFGDPHAVVVAEPA